MPDPKIGVAYECSVSLVDSSNRALFKSNPTLATGDVKISKDNAAYTNITTLPTCPNSDITVVVNLSGSEMTVTESVVVWFHDAAGAEWDDVQIRVLPTTAIVDDLVRSTTPGNTLTVDAGHAIIVGSYATGKGPGTLPKNTAFNNFEFVMLQTDGTTRATGLTVTAQRSLDGGAFGSCTNSVTEISNGWYKIDLSAGDVNANIVGLRFTGTGALPTEISIVTSQ